MQATLYHTLLELYLLEQLPDQQPTVHAPTTSTTNQQPPTKAGKQQKHNQRGGQPGQGPPAQPSSSTSRGLVAGPAAAPHDQQVCSHQWSSCQQVLWLRPMTSMFAIIINAIISRGNSLPLHICIFFHCNELVAVTVGN